MPRWIIIAKESWQRARVMFLAEKPRPGFAFITAFLLPDLDICV